MTSFHLAWADAKTLCVFDMLGANGPYFAEMKDYKTAALAWGVDFTLKPYTSERVAGKTSNRVFVMRLSLPEYLRASLMPLQAASMQLALFKTIVF